MVGTYGHTQTGEIQIWMEGANPIGVLMALDRACAKPSVINRWGNQQANAIMRKAKELVPKDTRTLERSIKTFRYGKYDHGVTADARYASYVEYGTSKMRAQPFLRPAVDYVIHAGAKNSLANMIWSDPELRIARAAHTLQLIKSMDNTTITGYGFGARAPNLTGSGVRGSMEFSTKAMKGL